MSPNPFEGSSSTPEPPVVPPRRRQWASGLRGGCVLGIVVVAWLAALGDLTWRIGAALAFTYLVALLTAEALAPLAKPAPETDMDVLLRVSDDQLIAALEVHQRQRDEGRRALNGLDT